jgi:hypothetical protein
VAAVSPQIDFKATVGDAVGQALINEALCQMLVAPYLQRPDLPQRQSSAIAESGAKRSLLGSYNAIHRNVSAVEDGLGYPGSEQEDEGMEEAELAAEDFEAEKNDIEFKKCEDSDKGPVLSSEKESSEEVPLEEESSEEESSEAVGSLW